ncbi:hypothetical protein JXB22_08975 [candidate division WOR-3 bacterium]|nr:hypothetical protein [candidate division WOR-3 bacterium]
MTKYHETKTIPRKAYGVERIAKIDIHISASAYQYAGYQYTGRSDSLYLMLWYSGLLPTDILTS